MTNLFLVGALAAGLELISAGPVTAQSLMPLHRFTALDSTSANHDGAYPGSGLILSGTMLYGTASQGGSGGGGTVFQVGTDGTGFAPLYNFSPTTSDGAYPLGGLVLASNTLYGTTSAGGVTGNGTVFKINIDRTGFAKLHAFTASDPTTGANTDGAAPWAGLVLSGTTLYGTATRGGDAGNGTVFKINTDGTGFMRLHSFAALDSSTLTNTDGAYPLGGLTISGSTLYGTTYRGGNMGSGTVFKVSIDGTGFTKLLDADGGPRATVIVSGKTLYGTTESGGSAGHGTVFKLNTDSSGFTNLQTFTDLGGPWGGLIVSGATLYGTTLLGGDSGQGTVFQVTTDGSGFTNLYSFAGGMDGAQPQAGLLLTNNILFGTASQGGGSGDGMVFGLSLGPVSTPLRLTIASAGTNVVLSWPASLTGLKLQSTTNLVQVIWAAVSPGPVVVNGQNTVTNPVSGAQRYYRLSQ